MKEKEGEKGTKVMENNTPTKKGLVRALSQSTRVSFQTLPPQNI